MLKWVEQVVLPNRLCSLNHFNFVGGKLKSQKLGRQTLKFTVIVSIPVDLISFGLCLNDESTNFVSSKQLVSPICSELLIEVFLRLHCLLK